MVKEPLTIQASVKALQQFLPASCLSELLGAPSMVYSISLRGALQGGSMLCTSCHKHSDAVGRSRSCVPVCMSIDMKWTELYYMYLGHELRRVWAVFRWYRTGEEAVRVPLA